MDAANDFNPDLLGIFYSYFHNIEGPKLAVQYPPECISLETFNNISDYIITKDQLCGNIIRVCVSDKEIIGYPIQISSQHYIRNAFNFNICFVVNKGKSSAYQLMVKKFALLLEGLEREKEFLQDPKCINHMETIITDVYKGLKENSHCDVMIDAFTRLILFPTVKPSKTVYVPKDYEVPYLCYEIPDILRLLPDTVLFEPILAKIDTIYCVHDIYKAVDMDILQVKACLSFLFEVGVIGFIDKYDVCNIYILQDFEAIWKEDVMGELIAYSRKRQTKLCDLHKLQSSYNDSYVEIVKENVDIADVQALFSLFHANMSIYHILKSPIYTKIASVIDMHRFIVFCCIKQILRRVYVYPIIQINTAPFYNSLYQVTYKDRASAEVEYDQVGMMMDGGGFDDYHDEVSRYNMILHKSSEMYKQLMAAFHYSNHHSMYDKENGMSRHSSLISFNQDHQISSDCDCKPNENKIRRLIKEKYQCLESLSLLTECCIPSIIKCLQQMGDVLFLKM